MAAIVSRICVELNAGLRPSDLQITNACVAGDIVKPEGRAGAIGRVSCAAKDRLAVQVVVLGGENGKSPGAVADNRSVGDQIGAIIKLDDAVRLECNRAAPVPAGTDQVGHATGKRIIPGTSQGHVIQDEAFGTVE